MKQNVESDIIEIYIEKSAWCGVCGTGVGCCPSTTQSVVLRAVCISIGDADSQAQSRSAGSDSLGRGWPGNPYFKKFLCFNKILQVILLPSKI